LIPSSTIRLLQSPTCHSGELPFDESSGAKQGTSYADYQGQQQSVFQSRSTDCPGDESLGS